MTELERLGTVPADTIQKVRSVAEENRKELTRQALDVLGRKRELIDIVRIRSNLSSGYVPASAYDARFLEKHGTLADIQLLLDANGAQSVGSMKRDEAPQASCFGVTIRIVPSGCLIGTASLATRQ